MKPQLLIGSLTPNSGKTVFAGGLIRLLMKQGMHVQSFKSGSDFIDMQLLACASEKPSFHLDPWVASRSRIQRLYNRYGESADICLTEGTSGLFDGYDRMTGSSASIAGFLKIPVLLVVNAKAATYSVAAAIFGFRQFYAAVRIVGVVFNQVASWEHYSFLRRACNDAGVNCLGYLPDDEQLKIPSKHHCFTSKEMRSLSDVFDVAASYLEKGVEIDKLLEEAQRSFPVEYTLPYKEETDVESFLRNRKTLRIAVADDPAFKLTYHENILHWMKWGSILRFSPIYGRNLPEADIVYLPGGYPELFARQIYRRRKLLNDIKDFAEAGGRILAEDGGMVLLARSLSTREGGTAYEMANVLPIDITMDGAKIRSGYRQVSYNRHYLRGYEFHYTACNHYPHSLLAWKVGNTYSIDMNAPLLRYKNVLAGYTHLYLCETDLLTLWD